VRPTTYGLVEHLVQLHRLLDESSPSLAVLDATGGISGVGISGAVRATVARQIDMLKARGVTAVLTALTEDGQRVATAMEVTSLVDTWLLVRNTVRNGERNRLLYVIKSRGTAHSNQVREFVLRDRGAELLDVYVGPQGVLTGSARMAQLADERAAATARQARADRRGSDLARRTAQVEQQITALREEIAADRFDLDQYVEQDIATDVDRDADRAAIAAHRWADPTAPSAERTQP
jgi:circadian clock protein KaiC